MREYPIGGYAPGSYQHICVTCDNLFLGDKRAVQCETCAVKAVRISENKMVRKKGIIIGSNGGVIRMKNKRIVFEQVEDTIKILFQFATTDADKPGGYQKSYRRRYRETLMCISKESMDALVNAYSLYKENLIKSKKG